MDGGDSPRELFRYLLQEQVDTKAGCVGEENRKGDGLK